jgi:hypothetical protein
MLKIFESYEKEDSIRGWLKLFDSNFHKNTYAISNDGIIDVAGTVDISYKKITDILYPFGEVTGCFFCNNNELESLKNSPHTVGGSFNCQRNSLITLNYSPKNVGGDFDCVSNKLVTLYGAPKIIEGCFFCSNNKLVNLIGSPNKIANKFSCTGNLLISLEGAPAEIGDYFNFDNNVHLIKMGGCIYWTTVYKISLDNTPLGRFHWIFSPKEFNLIQENSDLFDKLNVFRIENDKVFFSGKAFVAFLRKLKQADNYNLDVICDNVRTFDYEVDE